MALSTRGWRNVGPGIINKRFSSMSHFYIISIKRFLHRFTAQRATIHATEIMDSPFHTRSLAREESMYRSPGCCVSSELALLPRVIPSFRESCCSHDERTPDTRFLFYDTIQTIHSSMTRRYSTLQIWRRKPYKHIEQLNAWRNTLSE